MRLFKNMAKGGVSKLLFHPVMGMSDSMGMAPASEDGPYIVDEARNLAPKLVDVMQIQTVSETYFGTYFVPMETLKRNLGDPVGMLLLFGCTQGPCIFTDFTAGVRSICSSSKLSGLCDPLDHSMRSELLGLEVFMENTGASTQPFTRYNLYIPTGMKLQRVVDLTQFRNTPMTKMSEAKTQSKNLRSLEFKGRLA